MTFRRKNASNINVNIDINQSISKSRLRLNNWQVDDNFNNYDDYDLWLFIDRYAF